MANLMTQQLFRDRKILDANLESIFLHKRDREDWMKTPNRDLDDLTPNYWADKGRSVRVLEVLKQQLGHWIDK